MRFGNIHQHSSYSNSSTVLDSIIKVEDIIPTAFELGWSFCALTDHNMMGGHLKFLKSAIKLRESAKEELQKRKTPDLERAANFKPILGNEIYVSREGLTGETHERGEKFNHFLLIAKDRTGWEQLNQLSKKSWGRMYNRGITRMPNYISDLEEVVGANPGHLIATTACLGGYLGDRIIEFGKSEGERRDELREEIINFIRRMKRIFGENFYLEIQPNQDKEQQVYNQGLVAFSKYLGVKLIIALDAHYKRPEDKEIHKAYLNSQSDVERETDKFYTYTYMMTEQETVNFLRTHLTEEDITAARINTAEIYNQVEFYDIRHSPIIPYVPVKDKEKWKDFIHKYDKHEYFKKFSNSNEANQFLIYQTIVGLEDKVRRGWLDLTCLPRLDEELRQIWEVSEKLQQNMATYFTTMQEIINQIWQISLVAPGRGSAGAFLLNYVLDITQINPLPYNFPLKRFLAAEKVSLADVDIDASSSKKSEIIEHLSKWGKTFNTDVFNIATYGTEKSKSALITAARGLGYEPEEGLYFASLVPSSRGFLWTLKECYFGNGDDKKPIPEFVQEMKQHPDVWKVAQEIEGLINQRSSHAAGIVFCNEGSFYQNTSVMKAPNGVWTTQFSLDDLEELGPTKYDLLSTKAIDAIQTELYLLAEENYIEWQGNLRDTYDKYLRPEVLDFEDSRIWEKVNKKEVLSLFQFGDSPQGIQAIELIQPQSLYELATINSVMRLMASDGGEMPLIQYKHRKDNPRLWYNEMARYGLTDREIKILEAQVGDTYGMCITQEQLMALVQDPKISGFSFAESDYVRKVVGKKKMSEIPALYQRFVEEGMKRGNRKSFIDYIWNELFAVQLGYALN